MSEYAHARITVMRRLTTLPPSQTALDSKRASSQLHRCCGTPPGPQRRSTFSGTDSRPGRLPGLQQRGDQQRDRFHRSVRTPCIRVRSESEQSAAHFFFSNRTSMQTDVDPHLPLPPRPPRRTPARHGLGRSRSRQPAALLDELAALVELCPGTKPRRLAWRYTVPT